jgi:hypothetical protein
MIGSFDLTIINNPTKPFDSYNVGAQVQWDMWMRGTLVESS